MDTCQEEEACKGMLLKCFGMRGAPSMLEKREMVSTRKKNRNITLSYCPRIPDLMRWTTAGSSLGIEIVRDSVKLIKGGRHGCGKVKEKLKMVVSFVLNQHVSIVRENMLRFP